MFVADNIPVVGAISHNCAVFRIVIIIVILPLGGNPTYIFGIEGRGCHKLNGGGIYTRYDGGREEGCRGDSIVTGDGIIIRAYDSSNITVYSIVQNTGISVQGAVGHRRRLIHQVAADTAQTICTVLVHDSTAFDMTVGDYSIGSLCEQA